MFIVKSPVEQTIELENNILVIKVYSPEISSEIKPGQFLNVRVSETYSPLLRRPFSVCDVEGDFIFLMFNVLGEGTKILAQKRKGETIDLLGPLGHGFNLDDDYQTAVIVAGGLGAAPFPYFVKKIPNDKRIISFVGGKTNNEVITYGLKNILISTDDGSLGFKGTVIDLLNENLEILNKGKIKIFSCGPNAMLKAIKEFSIKNNFECEVSIESAMACGFGICQGCPVESTSNKEKYSLVCKDGPVFNVRDIVL